MHPSSFSRTSSTGSIDNMLSPSPSGRQSTDCSPTTEDEDSDQKSAVSYKERRREAHTQAEQKRRDAIKRGYEDLQHLVPKCQQQDSVSSYKLSKASILQRSIDYIQSLQSQNKGLDEKRHGLQKEMMALNIMKQNYETIVRNQQQQQQQQQSQSGMSAAQVTDETRLQVFEALCDGLFVSFDETVSTNDFAELSAGIFSWLEQACKPQNLKHLTAGVLDQLRRQQQQ